MPTRRRFCQSLAAGSIALSPLARALATLAEEEGRFEVIALQPGFSAILGEGGNSLLVETEEGAILIDAKLPVSGPALVRLCAETIGAPPKILINTHHHGDHTGGNHAFKGRSRIIAHANCAPRVEAQLETYKGRAQRVAANLQDSDERRADALSTLTAIKEQGASAFAADELVSQEKNRLDLTLGGVPIRLQRFRNGHTDNDLIVHFPEANLLHTGDLVFNGMHPYMDPPAGAESEGWQASARSARALCGEQTVVIPGHGPVGDAAILEAQVAYFEALRAAVRPAVKEGATREQVQKLPVEATAALDWSQMLERNLGIVYDELAG
ncbi:MAG: MBL fold metallo-hydrolase [Phycisphaerales bacterium JB038]